LLSSFDDDDGQQGRLSQEASHHKARYFCREA
jgi:hypothetical protein